MPVTINVKEKADRVPSTIQFPYSDMSDAIAVADGLLKGGGVAMSRDQLAAAMGLAPGGGGFATKIATARIFGVLDSAGGKYQLTELGHEIVDPSRQAEAKVTAFLNVELYKRAYDEFRSKLLPPRPHGLDAAFISFGVTAKNVRFARLAFEKSARMAGLYPGGNEDRLVMPFGTFTPTVDEVHVAADRVKANDTEHGQSGRFDVPPDKELRYQLIDLLEKEGITDVESDAIWKLVRFLSGKSNSTLPPTVKE